MDDALRQSARPVALQHGELRANQRFQIAVDLVRALAATLVELPPTANGERISAAHREIGAGERQPRQRLAERAAMRRAWPANPHAVEKGDHRGRAAGELAEHLAGAVFHRLRTVDAATREVLH